MVRETTEKIAMIQDRILVTQSRQKNYATRRCILLEFEMET